MLLRCHLQILRINNNNNKNIHPETHWSRGLVLHFRYPRATYRQEISCTVLRKNQHRSKEFAVKIASN